MRKIIITCPCGQRMQVSRSAYGKIGVCPRCSQRTRIGCNGAEPLALPSPAEEPEPKRASSPFVSQPRQNVEFEPAKRMFARAVDFFYHADYSKALGLLDELRKILPGNPQVETARARCADALKAQRDSAEKAQSKPADAPEPVQPAQEAHADVSAPRAHPDVATDRPAAGETVELTAQMVHQTVLSLMTSGTPDAVRVQAAELAVRMLGLDHTEQGSPQTDSLFIKSSPANGKSKPPLHSPTGSQVSRQP